MKSVIFFLLISILCSCSNVGELIVLNNEITDKHLHVTEGLWMKPSPEYEKSEKFDGFYFWNKSIPSTISVKVLDLSLQNLMQSLEDDDNLDIETIYPVKVNQKDTAVLVEYTDTKRSLEKIDLIISIAKEAKTYYITSYIPVKQNQINKDSLRASLLTVCFGEIHTKEDLYKLAKIVSKNKLVLSKDGLFPTKSPDDVLIEMEERKVFDILESQEIISKTFNKDEEYDKIIDSIVNLENGYIQTISYKKDDKYLMVNFVFLREDGGNKLITYKFSGNTFQAHDEYYQYIMSNIKTTLR